MPKEKEPPPARGGSSRPSWRQHVPEGERRTRTVARGEGDRSLRSGETQIISLTALDRRNPSLKTIAFAGHVSALAKAPEPQRSPPSILEARAIQLLGHGWRCDFCGEMTAAKECLSLSAVPGAAVGISRQRRSGASASESGKFCASSHAEGYPHQPPTAWRPSHAAQAGLAPCVPRSASTGARARASAAASACRGHADRPLARRDHDAVLAPTD